MSIYKTMISFLQHSTAATTNWKSDPEGRPDSTGEKAAKGATKVTAKIVKILTKTGLVKGPAASALEGAADLAENQANIEGNATLGDRLRHGGKQQGNHLSKIADIQVTV